AFAERHLAALELADADLGALEIDEDADRPPDLALELPHRVVARAMIRPLAVAEVQAEQIGARRMQRADLVRRRRSGPERRNDLRGTAWGHSPARQERK